MVTRVGFGAAALLMLLLSACAPVGPVSPVPVGDPYSLGGTTIDLTYSAQLTRFIGVSNPTTFADLPAGLLPPVPVASYVVTLSVVGATVTGTTPPPGTLSLTSPAGTVTLSDGSISGVNIDFFSSATWTLQFASSSGNSTTYTVSGGSASLVTIVTDPTLLAQIMSITTQNGDNTATVQLGVISTDVPSGDTLTLQFGPGSAVYTF